MLIDLRMTIYKLQLRANAFVIRNSKIVNQ